MYVVLRWGEYPFCVDSKRNLQKQTMYFYLWLKLLSITVDQEYGDCYFGCEFFEWNSKLLSINSLNQRLLNDIGLMTEWKWKDMIISLYDNDIAPPFTMQV